MRALLLAGLLLPTLALAQAPAKIGYQGRLLKADGTPESGQLDITFAIHAQATGSASPLWSETQKLALSDGYYATMLGEQTALDPALFDGSERFLELTVGGTALSPRQRIDSVPYALAALHCTNLSGGTVDATSVSVGGKQVVDSSGKLSGTAFSTPAAGGLSYSSGSLSLTSGCAEGQVLKYVAGAWTCSAVGAVTAVTASGPLTSTGGLTPALSLTGCAEGQVLKYVAGAWTCSAVGAVTGVTAAAPLSSSGGTTPNLTMSPASATADGYLAKADFSAFAAKRNTGGRNLIDWATDANRWQGGGATVTVDATDGVEGSASFKFAAPVGGTGGILTYGDYIPVDPSRRYKGRVTAKMSQGAGTFYAGYVAYDANKTVLVGNGGTYGYFIVSAVTLGNTWTTFIGTIAGTGGTLATFPANTRFIKPLVITNYQNTGVTSVGSFEIYADEAPSFQALTSYLTNAADFTTPNTTTPINMKYTNVQQNTAPSLLQVNADGSITVAKAGFISLTANADVIVETGVPYALIALYLNGALVNETLAHSAGANYWAQMSITAHRQVNAGDKIEIRAVPSQVSAGPTLGMDNGVWSTLTMMWNGLE